MPKHLIICSDGTGNRGGKGHGTNVWRLYQAVDRHDHRSDPKRPQQLTYYDDGVGSEDFKLFKVLGGAFGFGLSRNIRELYTFLVKHYDSEDRIYMFGFSRGAFTVRSLAGMVASCGIIERRHYDTDIRRNELVARAFEAYRSKEAGAADTFKKSFSADRDVKIDFMGVWDTVDAVGVPFDELRDYVIQPIWPYKFHNRRPDGIKAVYHAIAIDDERQTFHPVIFDESPKSDTPVIEQVWFSGVHSNVGGGYPRDEMALVALDWMMRKAEDHELRFEKGVRDSTRSAANVHGKQYDSRSGLAAYYRYKPRDIAALCREHGIEKPKIHISVFERIKHRSGDYAPANVPTVCEVVPRPSDSQQYVATIWNSLAAAPARTPAQIENLRSCVSSRRLLYYALLITSAVGVILWIMTLQSGPEKESSWALSWAKEGVRFLVPDSAARFVDPLFEYWPVALPLVAVIAALFCIQRRIRAQIRTTGLQIWRSVFPY